MTYTQSDFDTQSQKFINQLNNIIILNTGYQARIGSTSIELELIENGQRVFGANVEMYAHIDWNTGEKNFQLSAGSMGAFNMSCKASVSKYLLMAELIKNFEAVSKLALQFMHLNEVMQKANYKK